jgi:Spy/CpxP family protein refolding chaperone
MLINIVALLTIALKSRVFGMGEKPGTENIVGNERDSFRDRERRFSESMTEKLQLTEEQQAGMEELRQANKERMKGALNRMEQTKTQWNEAMANRELDLERIQELNDEVASIDKEIRENLLEYNISIRKLLSKEQQDKYLEMLKSISKKKEERTRRGPPMDIIQNF